MNVNNRLSLLKTNHEYMQILFYIREINLYLLNQIFMDRPTRSTYLMEISDIASTFDGFFFKIYHGY